LKNKGGLESRKNMESRTRGEQRGDLGWRVSSLKGAVRRNV